ncbi:hypothetical protein P154DRAFT_452035 [Amniculicola lignicola CBS 123094]|uniref:Uncharacterized protein n=1 Tax=Amniculicola lignicola CBS 123094 TaxID=1392246 RepID=A0A6A5VUW9_9PLEO|nr:hypothetical protein P154DRAFT_452035 [Amniculicola lignicola CBS 123094]
MQSILRSRYQSLSLADAVGKILHATETIMLRESVKPHERERIKEALGVLLPHEARTMPTNKKQVDYERLLQKLYDAGGPQLVVVCVVGLGRSVILSLREQVKLHLPGEIKKHEETWNTPLLLSLAQDCWIEGNTTRLPTNRKG